MPNLARVVNRTWRIKMTGGDAQSPVTSGRDGPNITTSVKPPQVVVTGHGFLPRHGVTIRVIDSDGTASYFQYTADIFGDLVAALPTLIAHGTLQVSATDGQPDPDNETGIRWTNTNIITW
ncbi:hypothetical protein [Mycobacterium sp. SP-6446]|uniref:hypothetical protein n=1 Tax=Mycobacterium sp. SP-6446 TaxID=1834162 RepID=UPI0011154C5E|nr:hypothetical protein [Mycobacterium sp. SP-6446]